GPPGAAGTVRGLPRGAASARGTAPGHARGDVEGWRFWSFGGAWQAGREPAAGIGAVPHGAKDAPQGQAAGRADCGADPMGADGCAVAGNGGCAEAGRAVLGVPAGTQAGPA